LADQYIFTGIIRDITERKKFEQALKASEEAFRSAMENAPIGMAVVGIDGKWLRVNSALCKLVGYTEQELLATNVQSISHPDDAISNVEYMQKLMLGETSVFQVEKRYRHKKRHIVWVLLSLSLVRGDDGKPKHFVAQIQDITARREIDRMKNEFVSTVSHELRTPLTSIRGALGLIEGGASGKISEKTMNLVQIAHKNSQRLLRIINDILDVEKMESGKMEVHLQEMTVEPFLKQALEANQSYGDKFQVHFVLEPVAAMDIIADPDRLMQVITNLISNAAKFSPKGSEVKVRAHKVGDRARFEVIDHGQGIPEEFRARIFDKFAQADSSDTRRHEGTGLGLTIAKQLVERMGGDIGFTSEVGEGSTFYFHVPLATNDGSTPPQTEH
jgi:PAS domain S-box-containing protein